MTFQMNPRQIWANTQRSMRSHLAQYFGQNKHDYTTDFGWPTELTFNDFYGKYRRNGMAKAAVNKTVTKTWEDNPKLVSDENDEESSLEKAVSDKLTSLGFWQKCAEADRRAMVGGYSALIFRFADGKKFDKPVQGLLGLEYLVEVIVAWAPQLTVSSWDNNQESETYGQPLMYQFNEAVVPDGNNSPNTKNHRSFMVHPDRVVIWSRDGGLFAIPELEAGYNDLIDMEKVKGAGGEGFWKNAKAAPVLEIDKEASLREMASVMGVEEDELLNAMNKQVENYNKGFDNILMLQGMTSKPHNIQLSAPESFFMVALQNFAASMEIPLKVLVGSQSGERASTEDAREWSQTINARRNTQTLPSLKRVLERMVSLKLLNNSWSIQWTDLTKATVSEKLELAAKMANINNKSDVKKTGLKVFTDQEIRLAVDYPSTPKFGELMPKQLEEEPKEEPEDEPTGSPDPENVT